MRLNGFSDRGATELATALRAHLEADRSKLILDLRGNPGGYVTAARAVASQFIASGPMFWEEDAAGTQVSTDAQPGGVATSDDLQIVCLIDGGSASASEIVAGALQDTGRATLVGQTSFGKGTVQQWQELTGEGGAFRLTIARWLTPSKRWIHDIGLRAASAGRAPRGAGIPTGPTLDRALELLGGSADREDAGAPPCRARNARLPALALATAFGYGSWERKEVMCSDRQYASLHHLAGDGRLVGHPVGG